MKVGDDMQPDTDMGPVINEAALKKVHEYTEIGKKEHARLVHGGDFAGSEGWFYRPTIFADGKKEMRMAQEEIFGPSTLGLPVSNLEEALEVANSTQYGLSMSIYTNDLRKAFHAMDEMQSGIVYVNAPTIGAEIQLPFGGVKNTGSGQRAEHPVHRRRAAEGSVPRPGIEPSAASLSWVHRLAGELPYVGPGVQRPPSGVDPRPARMR